MTVKELLDNHPLVLSLPTPQAKAMEKALILAFRDNGIRWEKKKGIKVVNTQYYDFEIMGYTTSFGNSYFNIGLLYAEHVLPIWKKRFKK